MGHWLKKTRAFFLAMLLGLALCAPAAAAEPQQRRVVTVAFPEKMCIRDSDYSETADPVHEISIVPRGMAGGYTMSLPEEDKNYVTKRHKRMLRLRYLSPKMVK